MSSRPRRVFLFCSLIALATVTFHVTLAQESATPKSASLEATFRDKVQPFLSTYCTKCHGGEKPKGDIDLSVYTSFEKVAKNLRQWEAVLEQIDEATMPPPKAEKHPSAEDRRAIVAWIRDVRREEGRRNAGDPGHVPPRRLSNAEYDYSIRDLTGVDIRPAKEFPVDPANEAGFDNSAESLSTSPALLTKYLDAAQRVTEYLLFKPDGLAFAPFPVIALTDRDKFCVRQILEFYRRYRLEYADYFEAAWQLEHRGDQSPAQVAAQSGLSPTYLAKIHGMLTGPKEEFGPIAALQNLWLSSGDEADGARMTAEKMRDFVVKIRPKLVPDFKNPSAPGMAGGSQAFVYWKDRQMAGNRLRYNGKARQLNLDKMAPGETAAAAMTPPSEEAALQKYEASYTRFCALFPDAFVITERGLGGAGPGGGKGGQAGRLLSAGLHLQTGYFRDDGPIYELILNADEQKELDRLWLEFDVITGAPTRQYQSMIYFDREEPPFFLKDDEFNPFRSEDPELTSEPKIKELLNLWVAKVRRGKASDAAIKAIQEHFEILSGEIRRVEQTRLAAEAKHVASLQAFAQRAFRRPLSGAEKDKIANFYKSLRDNDALSHEDAIRDTLVSILMSPRFLFLGETISPISEKTTGKK